MNIHYERLLREAHTREAAEIERASRAFAQHYRPPAPVLIRALVPFFARGKVVEVGESVELPGDDAAGLIALCRAEKV